MEINAALLNVLINETKNTCVKTWVILQHTIQMLRPVAIGLRSA